jgi:hypothetical protein
MTLLNRYSRVRPWLAALLLGAVVAGCGGDGGRDPILGFGDVDALPPAVTAVTPVHQATGVALNNPLITAEFSQPMAPITGSATFTLTCAAPCTSPAASVALDADKRLATLTLAGALPLAPLTVYTATITGASALATGRAMAAPYSWQFTTVAAVPPVLPLLPPTVTAVVPVNNATGVARQNPVIAAVFSEPMAPITGSASFTLSCAAPCASPTGSAVSLDSAQRVATLALAPSTTLSPLTTYTATVSGATSLATGLALASPAVWRFTTGEGAAPVIPPVPPTVTAVTPARNAAGVALNNALISANFSEAMAAIAGSASFTVSCAAPCTSPAGTVSLDPTNRIATFAMASGASLSPSTTYTATVTGARSLATGLALASPYVWQFRTGLLADTTRPRVLLTVPATTNPGPTTGAPTNAAITALFTEDMAPASLAAATFRLSCAAPCVAPAGAVNYVVGNRTAVLTPAATLAAGTTYTVTITTGATDLAGNALAGNQAALPAASAYVWTFATAAAAVPPANVSVSSTNPAASAGGVCTDASINATFQVPSGLRMDPATINSGVFTVTGPAPGLAPVIAGSVVLDAATGRIASFSPLATLTAGITYTARIQGGNSGAKDLALPANAMLNDHSWTFSTVNCAVPPIPVLVPLGAAAPFGTFGGSAGMTSQGLYTVINGDIGTTAVSTAVTGFHDAGPGCTYTETPLNVGTVNGKIYTAAPPPTVACPSEGTAVTFAIASAARADALAAYNALVAMPPGPNAGSGNLANQTLAPGVYTAASGSFLIQGGDLTLDAQGNANAVWVFQMASTLTVGGPGAAFPRSIILANGALAKNVFWQVGTFATINAGGGGTMVGTIISQAGASFSTAGNAAITTLNGRALSLGASVTVVNTVINVPAP